MPLLDFQGPPQSRVETNFVHFAHKPHVKVDVASFHDDEDGACFSHVLQLVFYFTSSLPERFRCNARAVDVALCVPACEGFLRALGQ